MISKLKILISLTATLITLNQCSGNHYQGATASWRTMNHSNDSHILVKATFSYYTTNCNSVPSWNCYEWDSNRTACANLYNSTSRCTTSNVYGRYTRMSTVQFRQSIDDSITYRYAASHWWRPSTTYKQPTSISVPFSMNLTRRSDTGRPNSSPVAYMSAQTRVHYTCSSTWRIPTFDEDGDDVTCRFGENPLENGGVTNDFPYWSLNEKTCTLTYSGTWAGYYYIPVSIIVEDHSPRDPTTSFSYVPLQFILFVRTTTQCNVRNVIERPRENQKFTINSNEEFQIVVQARKYSGSSSISYIEVNGAMYMNRDYNPVHIGGGLYQTTFTWTPRDDDKGQNFVCFTAYDATYAIPSDQRCVIINVDVITCDHHTDPSNGTVSCTNSNIMDSTCAFTCNYGYKMIGEPVSECGYRGWSNSAPSCQLITCDPHSNVSDGVVNCTNSNIFDSQCTFVCNQGHKLVGEPVSQCGFDGWTTPAPSCPLSCNPEYTDPSNGRVNCTNSNIWNSTCEFSCDYSYELIGEPVSQCEFDGWSTNASSCQIITCDSHSDPSNGEVSCTNSNIWDSTCTFTCDYGYELIGEPLSKCGYYNWSTPAPSCQLRTCTPHTDPTDGKVNCSRSNVFNSTCVFTCEYAYELIGDPVSQCGVTGWNTTAPNCRDGCKVQGRRCSDKCDEASTSAYTCSCHRLCWELASDRDSCIPKIETTCTKDRIQVNVEKCAVDGDIMIGNYNPDLNLPAQCRPTETSHHYHFDIPLGECQSAVIDTAGGKRQSVLVKGWIEDPKKDLTNDSSLLARGSWYKVQVNCETESTFDISTSFDPDDSATSVVTEIGFGPIKINFDFYRNFTFQAAYNNEDYPLGFSLEDRIFFGIFAQTNDSDVELFTKSCKAEADPNPASVSQVQLINNGCLMDQTMRDYPASDPLRNHFSIEAFRFKTSLPGITAATDVRIECRVVVCLQLENVTTTCRETCVRSSSRSSSPDTMILIVDGDQLAGEQSAMNNAGLAKTTSDQGIYETGSILLKKSGAFHVIEGPQGGGSCVRLHIAATICTTLLATFLVLA